MKEMFIDINNISKVRANSVVLKKIMLKEGDLLFSRKGTVEITCVVTPNLIGSIITPELISVEYHNILD